MAKKPSRNAVAAEANTAVVTEEAVQPPKTPAPKLIKVRATRWFKDGNVYPREVKADEVIEVTPETYKQLVASAARSWERVKDV